MSQPPQGVKISAYIFFALAALYLLAMCAFIAVLGIGLASGEGAEQFIGFGIGSCFILVFAVLYGGVGYGLLKLQSWARIAAIVLAILTLCNIPLGTILGGVVLFFMFQEENSQAFS